jgi:hypothetical protein
MKARKPPTPPPDHTPETPPSDQSDTWFEHGHNRRIEERQAAHNAAQVIKEVL